MTLYEFVQRHPGWHVKVSAQPGGGVMIQASKRTRAGNRLELTRLVPGRHLMAYRAAGPPGAELARAFANISEKLVRYETTKEGGQ